MVYGLRFTVYGLPSPALCTILDSLLRRGSAAMCARACSVLRVTCYVLRVTCYVLRVTCYVSHVTCHGWGLRVAVVHGSLGFVVSCLWFVVCSLWFEGSSLQPNVSFTLNPKP